MSARRNLIISAVSNLSTAYNLVVINVVHVIIGYQYCGGPSNCSAEIASASTSCLAGAIVGQLAFGYIGDCLGRPRALQLTMAMSILGALASAFAVPVSSDPASIFVFLTITRFFLGVGVGGVYPLSATIASESSETNARGRNASLVFSMQGVANLLVPLVAWALLQVRPALSRPPTYLAALPPSCANERQQNRAVSTAETRREGRDRNQLWCALTHPDSPGRGSGARLESRETKQCLTCEGSGNAGERQCLSSGSDTKKQRPPASSASILLMQLPNPAGAPTVLRLRLPETKRWATRPRPRPLPPFVCSNPFRF